MKSARTHSAQLLVAITLIAWLPAASFAQVVLTSGELKIIGAQFLLVGLTAWLATAKPLLAQSQAPEPTPTGETSEEHRKPGPSRYAYFFDGGGRFVKVELTTMRIAAQWVLSGIAGVDKVVPHEGDAAADDYMFGEEGEGWQAEAAQYDPYRARLYLVTPVVDIEKADQGRAPQHFRILALELPRLSLTSSIAVETTLLAPRILLRPGGNALLVSYQMGELEGHREAIVEEYATADWHKLRTWREVVADQRPIVTELDEDEWFSADGQSLNSGMASTLLKPDRMEREEVGCAQLLSEGARARLKDYVTKYCPVRDHLGHAAVIEGIKTDDTGKHRVVFAADLTTKEAFMPIEVSENDLVQLSGDTKQIVVAKVEVRQVGQGKEALQQDWRTGRFRVYEASSGTLVKTFNAPDVAGKAHNLGLLCRAANPPLFFYGNEYADGFIVHVVNLKDGTGTRLPTTFRADSFIKCVITDR